MALESRMTFHAQKGGHYSGLAERANLRISARMALPASTAAAVSRERDAA